MLIIDMGQREMADYLYDHPDGAIVEAIAEETGMKRTRICNNLKKIHQFGIADYTFVKDSRGKMVKFWKLRETERENMRVWREKYGT